MTGISTNLLSARVSTSKGGGKPARSAAKDYKKINQLLSLLKIKAAVANISAKEKLRIEEKIKKIEQLLRIKHINFDFMDYDTNKKADEFDYNTRIDLAAKTMAALLIGMFAGYSAAGAQGALALETSCAALVLTTEIDAYMKEMERTHKRYTEPQTILLNELKLYREVMRMTDKNAKPTLVDFIEFAKYLKSLEK